MGRAEGERLMMTATILASPYELAAAAGLLDGQIEGSPVILIRGYRYKPLEPAAGIIRPADETCSADPLFSVSSRSLCPLC